MELITTDKTNEWKAKVLLVDDEVDLTDILAERLALRCIPTRVALSGADALSIIEQETFDVVLLDLKMPGMDGLETLRRIKLTHPGVQVIMLTGHGNERDRLCAFDLGAFDFLHKPVDFEVLVNRMKASLSRQTEMEGKTQAK